LSVSSFQAGPHTLSYRAPICVDLDGTLIAGDLFIESLIAVVRERFYLVFLFPIWLLAGIANFKDKIAGYHSPRAELLPYNRELLDFLVRKKSEGHLLYLTTAASGIHAGSVAAYLGIFDGVLASTADRNLKGLGKLDAIVQMLGPEGFFYAGNSRADLPIWRRAVGIIAVNTPPAVQREVEKGSVPITAVFRGRDSKWSAALRTLRPYQWVKNTLVFVPLLLAHQAMRWEKLEAAAIAFLAFSLCASSLYVLNDLLDLQADRSHPRKQSRSFACGALSIPHGLLLIAIMAVCTIVLTSLLPVAAQLVLALYAAVSLAYSARLKQFLFLDTIVLAFLYSLRLLVGGRATGIQISVWTLAFAIFFFLGLALLKRLTELVSMKDSSPDSGSRRAYAPSDIAPLNSFASSALYVSVLITLLYINSPDVAKLYRRPEALWFMSLPLLYWIGRMLMLANRGLMTDDPIVFAFKDPTSYLVGLAILICALLAT
jgi:4-hydroxybenzoate polyprenyltransferase